jgi:hypothetical protein
MLDMGWMPDAGCSLLDACSTRERRILSFGRGFAPGGCCKAGTSNVGSQGWGAYSATGRSAGETAPAPAEWREPLRAVAVLISLFILICASVCRSFAVSREADGYYGLL